MPKYSFLCSICDQVYQERVSSSIINIKCPTCNQICNRQMPIISKVRTTETVDKFLNKKHLVDQNETIKERKADYYWQVEVPKMVNSGTYTIETMLEQGWVYYDEKNRLVTRTKPPQKT